ncbi:MAG: tetratricopeptide repeat protein [Candidatus Syntrophoarchaeum sp.]|nr:tetratricopeptide repeat protein [Candidatus Syntrophoarchaeum sp.]
MVEAKDNFEGRVSRLANYLTRAYKYNKPSILFAMYLSEFLRSDVEKSLRRALVGQGLEVVSVDAGNNKDLPSYFSSVNSGNTVFSVHNMDKGFPEALQYLNFKREELVEHHVKAVFWVREEELARISLEAPDFFAFRNRVVEFMEVPAAEERRPALVEFALETEYRSLDELKRSIELKEKLLAELSAEDEISGYLMGSLGILYHQIGSYKKSLEYSKKALKIAQDIGDRQNEGALLGSLGIAYHALGQVEHAIEYHEQALAISKEIGDRRGEGNRLGNIGTAYYSLGQVERAIEYYEQALAISKEIGDRRNEGNWLNNLGVVFEDLEKYDLALACYLLASKIYREIRVPEIEKTENNIKEIKNKIGKEKFQKLMDTVEQKAEEIIQGILAG